LWFFVPSLSWSIDRSSNHVSKTPQIFHHLTGEPALYWDLDRATGAAKLAQFGMKNAPFLLLGFTAGLDGVNIWPYLMVRKNAIFSSFAMPFFLLRMIMLP
jgi:hypothetical protein